MNKKDDGDPLGWMEEKWKEAKANDDEEQIENNSLMA